jgi:hypothetical protein
LAWMPGPISSTTLLHKPAHPVILCRANVMPGRSHCS